MDPSPHFLLLAATLLESLGPNPSDAALARLHAIFGPMMMSALELVDRREVVRVDVGGREIYQVTSAAGAPYTLYLDLPCAEAVNAKGRDVVSGERGGAGDGDGVGVGIGGGEDTEDKTMDDADANPGAAQAAAAQAALAALAEKEARASRLRTDAAKLAHMYCPCTGYAFNALDGRQILCKHILAVLVADRLGRVVQASVGVHAAAGLLGIVPAAA